MPPLEASALLNLASTGNRQRLAIQSRETRDERRVHAMGDHRLRKSSESWTFESSTRRFQRPERYLLFVSAMPVVDVGRAAREMRRRRLVAFCCAIAAVMAVAPAAASVVRAMSLEDLVRAADCIVLARARPSVVVAEANGSLFTATEFDVEELLLGPATTTRVRVRTEGGTLGSQHERIEGEPSFRAGQTYLLMLRHHPAGGLASVAMAQGAFLVGDDNGLVSRDLGALTLVGSVIPPMTGISLDELQARIRAFLTEEGR